MLKIGHESDYPVNIRTLIYTPEVALSLEIGHESEYQVNIRALIYTPEVALSLIKMYKRRRRPTG